MQLKAAYEGYFNNGQFYALGKAIHIPERKRVLITILDDMQRDIDKQLAWDEFKRMAKDTEHENVLLDEDIFQRKNSGRSLIDFANEG